MQDAIGRVQAIASVHDLLSDETRLSGATIDAIARLVADELKVTLIPPSTCVSFAIEPTDVVVPTRQATVLALLFNELISNSIEHGFEGRNQGRIAIRTWKTGNLVTIEVENDGAALPAEFDPHAKAGIGLRIITRLVESDLKGEFAIDGDGNRTIARMTFPAAD
ncbi:MAG: sensor histidine kinase [Thermomicrobiales bacterium]